MGRKQQQARAAAWPGQVNQWIAEHPGWVYVGLALLTFIVYAQVLRNDFVNFDDSNLIFENPVVTEADQPVVASFTWGLYTAHYKPVTLLSWWLEFQLYGENAIVFHLNNLLLHIINVLLVFFLARVFLDRFEIDRNKTLIGSVLVAVLFAVHPLHVESVAWAVERKDVLYSFFFLSAWLVYVQYLDQRRSWLLVVVAALYLLSLLSKSMGITLIAVLWLTDFLYQRKDYRRMILEKAPVLLCLLLAAYLYGLFGPLLSAGGDTLAVAGTKESILEAGGSGGPSLPERLFVNATKLLLWLLHLLIPVKLSVTYSGQETMKAIGSLQYLAPFLLAALLYFAYRFRKARREILFGLLFFIITISPTLPLSHTGGVGIFLSDRYTYIPMLGLAFVVVATVLRWKVFGNRNTALAVVALPVLALSVMSMRAVSVWENSETLWTNAINQQARNAVAYNGRGKYYLDRDEYERALADFDRAIALHPGLSMAHLNRSTLLVETEDFEEALLSANAYLALKPEVPLMLQKRSYIFEKLGQLDLALADINAAIARRPEAGAYYVSKADILKKQRDLPAAMQNLERAIALSPDYWLGYQKRALIFEAWNQLDSALASINQALAIESEEPLLYNNQALILAQLGRMDEARTALEQCLALDGTYEPGLATRDRLLARGGALGTRGVSAAPASADNQQADYLEQKAKAEGFKKDNQVEEAIQAYGQCIELAPDNFSNYIERGALYLNSGRSTLAVRDFSEALRLNPDFSNALLFRSMAYNNLQQYTEALRDARAAMAKGVQVDAAYLNKIETAVGGE